MSDIDPKAPTTAELTEPRTATGDPAYLAWAEEKIRKSVADDKANPQGRALLDDVMKNTVLVELSASAQTDLEAIEAYIAIHGHTPNPQAARQTVTKILKAIEVLNVYPRFGKPGRVPGMYELDVTSVPHFVVYRFVSDDHIVVTTIFHESRIYPPDPN